MAKELNQAPTIDASSFVKLLRKKEKFEKQIAKLQGKIDKVKEELKPFKKLVEDLTK